MSRKHEFIFEISPRSAASLLAKRDELLSDIANQLRGDCSGLATVSRKLIYQGAGGFSLRIAKRVFCLAITLSARANCSSVNGSAL